MTGNYRLQHINSPKDVEQMDGFSFSHNAIKKALFYKVIKLIRPVPPEDLDRLHTPLAKALTRIYRRYLSNEKQAWRREVMERVIPFMIIQVAEEGDRNYHEVFVWMLYELWRDLDAGTIDLPLDPLCPLNWHDGYTRDRIHLMFQGKSTTNKLLPEMPDILGGIEEDGI